MTTQSSLLLQQQQQQHQQRMQSLQDKMSQMQHFQMQAQQQQQQQQQSMTSVPTVVPPTTHSHSSISSKSQPFAFAKSEANTQSTAPAPAPAYLLPSTMLAPSVLTSVLMGSSNKGSSASVSSSSHKTPASPSTSSMGSHRSMEGVEHSGSSGSHKKDSAKRSRKKSTRTESPQHVLERLLTTRGYGANAAALRIKADQANYDTLPSPLQLASFGTELVKAIHTSDCVKLARLLSVGLSPNPCNQFRDSIVDLVCKRANAKVFMCLVENGCELRVCDGFGRTPLHHCCWASTFSREIAEIILQVDWKQLLIEDKRGQTPLEYVRPEQADDWIEFLEENQDLYFPRGGAIPPVVNLKETRPDGYLPDPPNALPVQLATAVSAGQLTPDEVDNLSPEMRSRFS